MITEIANSLYTESPDAELLYHYTSLGGLKGIVESKSMFATELGYLNDSSEFIHALDLIKAQAKTLWGKHSARPNLPLLEQLNRILSPVGIMDYNKVYVSSFTLNGNLLSQWRGYSPRNQGISIGFRCDDVQNSARAQGFEVGRCVYSDQEKERIINEILAELDNTIKTKGPNLTYPEDSTYADCISQLKPDLLRICALIKDSAFSEENEWRIVSRPVPFIHPSISFRIGLSCMTPYIDFRLPLTGVGRLRIPHAYLGPTTDLERSHQSVRMFLAKHQINRENMYDSPQSISVSYSGIPYNS